MANNRIRSTTNRNNFRYANSSNYDQESFYNLYNNDNDNDNDNDNSLMEEPNSPVNNSTVNNYGNIDEDYNSISNQNISDSINSTTTDLIFSDIVNPINDSCPITQEEFEGDDEVCMINQCKHLFKKNELINWLKEHQTCPSCRYNILTNTNYIRYTNGSRSLILTSHDFRRFLANEIVSTLINNTAINIDND